MKPIRRFSAWLMAALLTSLSASAEWRKLEDFQTHVAGQSVSSAGGWVATGSATYPVIADSARPGNQFLRVTNSTNAVIRLSSTANSNVLVPNTDTATLFVRFRYQGRMNYGFGLSDVVNGAAFGSFESQFVHNDLQNSAKMRDAGNSPVLDPASPLVAGKWYSLWMVVNNVANTTTVYLDSTTAPGQSTSALQSSGAKTAFSFRNGGSNALNSLLILTSNNHLGSLDLDDIHIDPTGQNLISPVPLDAIQLSAADDQLNLSIQGTATIDPLENDTTTYGTLDPNSLTIVQAPTNGSVQIDPVTRHFRYTHNRTNSGTDQFRYQITNSLGISAQAIVRVNIASHLRTANSTLILPPDAPAGGQLQVVDALPGLTFPNAVAFTTVPGLPKALLVASIDGNVWMVPNTTVANPVRMELFNVASLSNFTRGRSIYGITCHPNFATNGHIIVNYQGDLGGLPPVQNIPNLSKLQISEKSTPWREVECALRVSRFTVTSAQRTILLNPASTPTQLANTKAAVLASEHRYLNIAEEHAYHSINDCKFDKEGYLYISFGDEGSQGEPYRNAQSITRDFFSSIIRIDVDRRAGNVEPNPHYSIVTDNGVARYKVPVGNPYLGANPVYNGQAIPPADLSKVRTEIWATGLRNPFKFDINLGTGEIWVGDIGMDRFEEVSIINKGDNGGWSYWEGNERRTDITHAIQPAVHKLPEYTYPHTDGNNSITGGVYYRGSAYSSLGAKYIFGDYGSGKVWALTRPKGNTPQSVVELPLGGVPGLVAFAVDRFYGQILMLQHGSGSKVMRLIEGSGTVPFPQLLSETGAFEDLATLTPNPGVVPYEPNLTFWSDASTKSRFFAIKNLSDSVGGSVDGNWAFPPGMVFIKHFEMDLDRDTPGGQNLRLETRFLVRNEAGSYGVSYRWNEEGTDANLVGIDGEDFDIPIVENGTTIQLPWHVPARGECLTCHTPAAGHALSFNTAQLNRQGSLAGTHGNYLNLLTEAGYLTGVYSDPATLPRHYRPDETGIDLEKRARSYLAVNCSYCHHAGSTTPPSWDGRNHLSITESRILHSNLLTEAYKRPGDKTAIPGSPDQSVILSRMKARGVIGAGTHFGYTQMPPLGSNVPDAAGIALIEEWLLNHANLPPAFAAVSPLVVSSPESALVGTSLAALATTDPDVRGGIADQSLRRFSITGGNDHSLFSIDPDSGHVTVNGMLNDQRQASHQLAVSVTDQFTPNPGITGLSLTVNVTDSGDGDSNDNGLPDFWESQYSLAGATRGGDGDFDGLGNFFEFLSGRNPKISDSGESFPRLLGPVIPPELRLEWRYRNGLLLGTDYRLLGSADLKNWRNLLAGVDYEIIAQTPDGPGFSRLRIKLEGIFNCKFVRLSD